MCVCVCVCVGGGLFGGYGGAATTTIGHGQEVVLSECVSVDI